MVRWLKSQIDKMSPWDWVSVAVAVVGGLIALWVTHARGWFESDFAPLIVPVVVFTIMCGLVGARQLDAMVRARHPKGNPGIGLESKIKQWLDESGYSVGSETHEGLNFTLLVRIKRAPDVDLNAEWLVILQQHKKTPELITFATKLRNQNDQVLSDKITGNAPLAIIPILQIELARMGIMFSGVKHPLREVTFTHIVPVTENFSRLTVMEGVMRIVNAQVVFEGTLTKAALQAGISLPKPLVSEPDSPQQVADKGRKRKK
jgi:hypothetical protein